MILRSCATIAMCIDDCLVCLYNASWRLIRRSNDGRVIAQLCCFNDKSCYFQWWLNAFSIGGGRLRYRKKNVTKTVLKIPGQYGSDINLDGRS